jgi:glycosyltransferase 2 family protein
LTVSRNIKIGFLGLVVSALAFTFIGSQIRLELFVQALLTANYLTVVPCIVFLLLGLVTRALRWRVLLSNSLPLNRAFSIMNVAYLVNGVLPLRLGEVVRMYLASRVGGYDVPLLKTAGTILVERLLDLLAVVVMVLLAFTVAPVPKELQYASALGAISAVSGFFVLIFWAHQRASLHRLIAFMTGKIVRLQTWHLTQRLDEFLDGLLPLTQPKALLSAVGWTTISWVLSAIAGYWLMFAIFDEGNWATTLLYIAAAAFAIAVPAVPGNLGTYEGSILLALTAMGYSDVNQMAAFAVLVHAVNVFVHVCTGIVGFIQEGISLNQLQQGVRHMQQLEG